MITYKILRFAVHKDTEVIKRGLTLEEAKEHCNRADTRGKTWFDGYEME